jgi:hypothetical protein
MRTKACTRLSALLGLSAVIWWAGCTDQSRQAPNEEPPTSDGVQDRVAQSPRDEFPTIVRLQPRVEAIGQLRPGVPIRIRASVKANRGATKGSYEVWSLDEDESGIVGPSAKGHARLLRRESGGLGRGSQRQLEATITFTKPGYYRVLVRAVGSSSEPRMSGDSTIVDAGSALLRILVEDKGGRVSSDYDATALAGRQPKFGAYGSFVKTATPASQSLRSSLPVHNAAFTSSSLASTAGYNWSGHVSYYEANPTPQNLVLTPLADALVSATCIYPVTFGGSTSISVRTDANGNFNFTCPSPYIIMTGDIFLSKNPYVYSLGKDGAVAGTSFSGSAGGFFDLRVANDVAVHVFNTLSRQVPKAFAKFTPRTRPLLRVYVADIDANYGINYNSGDDLIRTNYTRVYGEDGEFVSTHEYGHAFHYKAIETPNSYSCNNNSHSINVANQVSCAFVEGFADFFSVWVAGDQLTSGSTGGYSTDNAMEDNPWRALGDGSRIEGASAAFMYDLVDGASESDSPTNTANGDETFDTATYPGSFVVQAISACTLTVLVVGVTKLDGMDQFVYCVERSVSAQPLGVSWRSYNGITPPAAPAGWDPALIRRLWRYNMYNVAP